MNSTTQLHQLLVKVRDLASTGNDNGEAVWRAVLGAQKPETKKYMLGVADAFRAHEAAVFEVTNWESCHRELHLNPWVKPTYRAIEAATAGGKSQEIVRYLNAEVMMALRQVAHQVPSTSRANELPAEQLQAIRTSVETAIKMVRESSLELGLRIWLNELLRDVEVAIASYEFFGERAVRDALAALTGGLEVGGAERPGTDWSKWGNITTTVTGVWKMLVDAYGLVSGVPQLESSLPRFSELPPAG